MVCKCCQTFAERFGRALKLIASCCVTIAPRPPMIALALGSTLLGAVQTRTVGKRKRSAFSKITQQADTLSIYLLILRIGVGAVVLLLRSSSPCNGCARSVLCLLPAGLPGRAPGASLWLRLLTYPTSGPGVLLLCLPVRPGDAELTIHTMLHKRAYYKEQKQATSSFFIPPYTSVLQYYLIRPSLCPLALCNWLQS